MINRENKFLEANNEDEMSSFDNLDETRAQRKLHAYEKETTAKSKISKEPLRSLFLIKVHDVKSQVYKCPACNK